MACPSVPPLRPGERTVQALAVVALVVCGLIGLFERLDEAETYDLLRNEELESVAEASVPNYKRVWYARNLLWSDNGLRNGELNIFGSHLFPDLPSPGIDTSRTGRFRPIQRPRRMPVASDFKRDPDGQSLAQRAAEAAQRFAHLSEQERTRREARPRPWQDTARARGLCKLDSDGDGWSNGAELGDPCCVWSDGVDPAFGWYISHPADPRKKPCLEIQRVLNETACEQLVAQGHYDGVWKQQQFKAWFYESHDEDTERGALKVLARLLLGGLHLGLIAYLAAPAPYGRGLWRGLGAGPRGRLQASLVVAAAYLYCDLTSAFLHAFFDNCHIRHPLMGNHCLGFKFHHYHPRSLSLEPYLYWYTHALGPVTPLLGLYVVQGAVYEYPRSFELFLLSCAVFWPLGFVWHNLAHLPDEERSSWFQALQAMGLALSTDLHIVHHREINHTWSVMAGMMDFVPNFLAATVYDRKNARATWGIIWLLAGLPWYAWFAYFTLRKRKKILPLGKES